MFVHHFRPLLALSLLAGSFFMAAAVAASGQPVIYRWVDDNGTVHYSDAPPPDKPAQEADLPGITVVPARHFKQKPSKADKQDSQEKDSTEKNLADLSQIKLVRPKPEENLWGTGGTVTAEVDFPGRLPRGYAIQFVLDGKPLKPVRKKVYVIKEVIRGEHTLYAQIIEVSSGTVLAKTDPVTFYLKQATVNMHNNG